MPAFLHFWRLTPAEYWALTIREYRAMHEYQVEYQRNEQREIERLRGLSGG